MRTAPMPAGDRYSAGRTRPRWRPMVAAAGLVIVLTVGVSGSAAGSDPTVPEPVRGPEVVVREYLRVLQSGDAGAARGYATAAHGLAGAADDLLVPQAMGTGWTVTQLVRRHHPVDGQAFVDVEITAAGGAARQGRFELQHRPGGWTILNPLVRVDFSQLPVRFVEVNRVSTRARKVWLFPGTYHTFGSIRDLLQVQAPAYVVVPGLRTHVPDAEATPPPGPVAQDRYLPHVQLTETGTARLHEQLHGWIDECAATGAPFPTGCPFAAGDRRHNTLYIGTGEYHPERGVSWQVSSYPQVQLTQTRDVFTGQLIAPGQLQVSGTGTSVYGDGRQTFQGTCTIWLADLQVALTPSRRFTIQFDNSRNEFSCDTSQYYH